MYTQKYAVWSWSGQKAWDLVCKITKEEEEQQEKHEQNESLAKVVEYLIQT
jgi:hypothetical protein